MSIEKSEFNSKIYYWTVLLFLSSLILWNLYAGFLTLNGLSIIPIFLQLMLLYLIITRHRFAKIGIKTWAYVFLIGASFLKIFGRWLQDLESDSLYYYIDNIIIFVIGVLIVRYANKTID